MTPESSNVLVVDDDPNLTDLLVDTLAALGYQPFSAGSAPEALQILSKTRIDLVISDINMPEMSGLELLQEIKKKNQRLPVMLITGISTDSIKDRAFSQGADGFLSKPFRIGTMEVEIGKLLQGLQRRRIAIIDDNQDFLSSLRQQLEERDNEVVSFTTIEDAAKHLSTMPVDLVITDLKMPDGDGISLVDRLRARFPQLPVIMVSAYATDELITRIGQAGIQKFLAKPFNFTELDRAVQSLVPEKSNHQPVSR